MLPLGTRSELGVSSYTRSPLSSHQDKLSFLPVVASQVLAPLAVSNWAEGGEGTDPLIACSPEPPQVGAVFSLGLSRDTWLVWCTVVQEQLLWPELVPDSERSFSQTLTVPLNPVLLHSLFQNSQGCTVMPVCIFSGTFSVYISTILWHACTGLSLEQNTEKSKPANKKT